MRPRSSTAPSPRQRSKPSSTLAARGNASNRLRDLSGFRPERPSGVRGFGYVSERPRLPRWWWLGWWVVYRYPGDGTRGMSPRSCAGETCHPPPWLSGLFWFGNTTGNTRGNGCRIFVIQKPLPRGSQPTRKRCIAHSTNHLPWLCATSQFLAWLLLS